MQYRVFPKIPNKPISILGFGMMRLPLNSVDTDLGKAGETENIDIEASRELVKTAFDAGVNYFDTAYPYHGGKSEVVLGQIVRDLNIRDKIYIADKLPTWLLKDKGDPERLFNEQLERLGLDYIDFYLLHALDDKRWQAVKETDAIAFVEKLKKEGKIRHIGFSFHHEAETFYDIVDYYDGWEFCQLQYNYLDENYQAGKKGLQYAASKGIGIIDMEPLRGGLLGNPPKAVTDIFAHAAKPRMSAEWALRWVWDHQEVVCALSGMGKMHEVLENCATATAGKPNSLPQSQLKIIDQARQWFENAMKVPCTGCRYCVPCPTSVFIPELFSEYNRLSMNGAFEDGKDSNGLVHSQNYIKMKNDGHGADKCVNCGACVSHCPQQIAIPQRLKEMHSLLA
ncbi:MAG: aldo/keto reductase [Spirochaetales bacterium]